MNKRSRVISATILAIVGITVMIVPSLGGSSLHAAGLQSTGYDVAKYLVWGGVAILAISAVLFVSASTD